MLPISKQILPLITERYLFTCLSWLVVERKVRLQSCAALPISRVYGKSDARYPYVKPGPRVKSIAQYVTQYICCCKKCGPLAKTNSGSPRATGTLRECCII